MSEVSISGMITGKSELGLYDKAQLKQFCNNNPNSNIIVNIKVLSHSHSKAMEGYYYGKIIPDMVAGFYETGVLYSKEECDQVLRALCPITRTEEFINGSWKIELKEIGDLDNKQFVMYIEWLHQIYSEYMNIKENVNGSFSTVRFNNP